MIASQVKRDLAARQKVLVYGPPLSGKSTLISQLATEFNLLWFDLEAGSSVIFKLPEPALDRINLIKIQNTVETPRAHATLDKLFNGGTHNVCIEHGSIDCRLCKDPAMSEPVFLPTDHDWIIVIDSLTELTTSINSTANKHLGSSLTLDFVPSRKETNWGAEWDFQGKYLNRILSKIQTGHYNIVCTAHEIESEREDGSIRIVPSIGTRNYAINSSRFFDHIVYMDKVNLKHVAFSDTSYSSSVVTGSRLDIALEGLETPSLLPIFRGEAGKGRDSVKTRAASTLTAATTKLGSITLPGMKK